MSTSQDGTGPDRVETPTVSTAPGGTTTEPPGRWWHWGALPDHLGRARTSTVILGVLFLAVFALYLNVKPETAASPAGGGSDVEAPVTPSEPTAPGTTDAPATTTGPEGTGTPEETGSPTTGGTPGTTGPRTTEPSEDTSGPTGTTSEPTGGTTGRDTPATTPPGTP